MEKFKKFIIIMLIISAVMFVIQFAIKNVVVGSIGPRSNSECTLTERVFDEADVLTDDEEQELRELIAEQEAKIGCDIVLLLIYEEQFDYYNDYNYYKISDYLEQFYAENKLGWNGPGTDAVIYVDNWYGEPGYYQSYLYPFGSLADEWSYDMKTNLVDRICENTNYDKLGSYKKYVNGVVEYASGLNNINLHWPIGLSIGLALVITIIFTVWQLITNAGKRTTQATTYVNGGRPDYKVRQDIFLTKHTTRRRIESSGGGGGGGRSGGGGGAGGRH